MLFIPWNAFGFALLILWIINCQGVSDNESNDASGTLRKAQKPWRGKGHLSISKEDLLRPPSVANDGCLSLLKRSVSDGNRLCF